VADARRSADEAAMGASGQGDASLSLRLEDQMSSR
jgi:hypothetical protein